MRALTKLNLSMNDVFSICVDSMGHQSNKDKHNEVRDEFIAAAEEYELKAVSSELYSMPACRSADNVLLAGQLTKEKIKRLYEYYLRGETKPGRAIYNSVLNIDPMRICPNCGYRESSTVDHYLPQSKYPFFVIYTSNLVPCCSKCNTDKLASVASDAGLQVFHPYYDHDALANHQWLFARVREAAVMAVEYYVEPPAEWSDVLKQRAHSHLAGYKLTLPFSIQAANELTTAIEKSRRAFKNRGANEVRYQLSEEFEVAFDQHKNHWKTALYQALHQSDWFCSGGFQNAQVDDIDG